MTKPRLYIFDADGTLRWTTIPGQKYPIASDQWQLMPHVREVLARIPLEKDHGPWMAIASNQNGVADGLLTEEQARRLMQEMLFGAVGEFATSVCVKLCVCSERDNCDCRKPAPGLLLELLAHFDVAAADAIYIGDLPIDEEAAARAGIPFVWARDFFVS